LEIDEWLRTGKEKELTEAWRVIYQFIVQNITKKKEEKVYEEDILHTIYINEDPKEGEEKLTDNKFIRNTMVNLMLGGRDTMGVAFTWFFWLLAKNPEVKSKKLSKLKIHSSEAMCLGSPIVFDMKRSQN